ncbi:uncharacterized protein DNG_07964 [Cephalotrichum gorgonifer]|uniref:Heterokaryon incompatibility domain-containing protein n=1 Tax=Cephalotrichum gorgonifer TaxID=2041049 RepID=A0AAE8N5L9_9PEZI|nr:uncharacterized protein DNG_07964 [Cephalotrichum gorgonifer]
MDPLLSDTGPLDSGRELVPENAEEIRKRELAERISSMEEQGKELERREKLEEAESVFREVVDVVSNAYGKEHYLTGIAMNRVAITLSGRGGNEEAERIFRCNSEFMRKALGESHPIYLSTKSFHALSLMDMERPEEAERILRQVLGRLKETVGDEYPLSIECISHLAGSLLAQGKYTATDQVIRAAIPISERVLGVNHIETVKLLNKLGLSLMRQGRYEDEEQILRQVLERLRETWGEEHRNVGQCVVSLTKSLISQKKHAEAEQVIRQSIPLNEKILGVNHIETVKLLNDLGVSLGQQGRYGEAERVHRQALQRLQESPPDEGNISMTLATSTLIALTLMAQEQLEEARELLELGLHQAETTLGEDFFLIPDYLMHLAEVLSLQGKHAEGEQLLRRALRLREQVNGPEHPLALAAKTLLAGSLLRQDAFTVAEKLYREVLKVRLEVLGEDHPETIQTMDNLTKTLGCMAKYRDAGEMYRRAVGLKAKLLGPEHPSTLESMSSAGDMLVSQGMIARGIDMHRETCRLRERTLGKEHASTLSSLNDLGGALMHLGEYTESEHIFRSLSEIMVRLFGAEDVRTVQASAHLGLILNVQAKYGEGQPMLRAAVEDLRRILGEEHHLTTRSMHHLALAAAGQEDYAEAEDLHRQVIEIQERIHGNNDARTLDSKGCLGGILLVQERYEEAEQMLRTASEGLEAVLGDTHPTTIRRMNQLSMVLDKMTLGEEAEEMDRRTFELSKRALEEQPEPPVLEETNSRLCIQCVQATTRPLLKDGTTQGGSRGQEFIAHFADVAQLEFSARACPLCQDILAAVGELKTSDGLEDHEIRNFTVVPLGLDSTEADMERFGIHMRSVICTVRGKEKTVFGFNARVFGPEIEGRLGQVSSWLEDCRKDHSECGTSTTFVNNNLPTRLIDLGEPGTGRDPCPRLVDTADLGPSISTEYTALSHCWGPQPCTSVLTTRTNEALNREKIAFGSLPKTYRDAMMATASLGIRFIWIDSLCIIQGDKEDWSAEAATMSGVYQHCTLVLAAASSPDAHGGFFLDSFRQPRRCSYLLEGEPVPVELWDYRRVDLAPLNTRGWTLQETLLARRIVYFSRDQIYWQCRSHSNSEDGVITRSKSQRMHEDICVKPMDFGSRMVMRDHWAAWVKNYTSRELSHGSDYMAAFSGITQFFADRMREIDAAEGSTETDAAEGSTETDADIKAEIKDTTPALGLWTDVMFAIDLGWSAHDLIGISTSTGGRHGPYEPLTPRRSALASIPSWSWFRYQMPIYGHLFSASDVIAKTRLVSFAVEWSGTPMTSDVVSSRLVVKGPVKVLELAPQAAPRLGQYCSFTEAHLACFLDEGDPPPPSMARDERGLVRAPCLLLSMQPLSRFATFMVLEEVPGERARGRKRYRRVGIGHFGLSLVSLHPFMDAERVKLELE